jgi:hypothetical protein
VTRVTKDRSAHCGKKSLARQAVRILTGGPQGRHLLRISTAWRKWAGKYTKFMQRDVRITAQMESTIQTWGGSLEKTTVSPPSMNFVDEHDVAAANPSRKNLRSRHFARPRGRFRLPTAQRSTRPKHMPCETGGRTNGPLSVHRRSAAFDNCCSHAITRGDLFSTPQQSYLSRILLMTKIAAQSLSAIAPSPRRLGCVVEQSLRSSVTGRSPLCAVTKCFSTPPSVSAFSCSPFSVLSVAFFRSKDVGRKGAASLDAAPFSSWIRSGVRSYCNAV